jgi:hypothetical protein
MQKLTVNTSLDELRLFDTKRVWKHNREEKNVELFSLVPMVISILVAIFPNQNLGCGSSPLHHGRTSGHLNTTFPR